jgi:hypothetical protein
MILIGLAFTTLLAPAAGEGRIAFITENAIFAAFTNHIARQVAIDKRAFAQASSCLSWFYKKSKPAPPPAVQGITWNRTASSSLEQDCPRQYPGGMDSARDDFARTQALLSVSLTVYELALVADHNDDHAYNATELRDLFGSLSLTINADDSAQTSAAVLTNRFNHWYQTRNLDEVMKGMSTLYERGYRVTANDRAELDRVMK